MIGLVTVVTTDLVIPVSATTTIPIVLRVNTSQVIRVTHVVQLHGMHTIPQLVHVTGHAIVVTTDLVILVQRTITQAQLVNVDTQLAHVQQAIHLIRPTVVDTHTGTVLGQTMSL